MQLPRSRAEAHPSSPSPAARAVDVTALAALVCVSLVLTSSVNGWSGKALYEFGLGSVATAAVPSCLTIFALFLLFADRTPLRWPRPRGSDRVGLMRLGASWLAAWLAGSAIAAAWTGRWIVYAHGMPETSAFLVFGPIGEELMFRGLIFERARRVWPASKWFAVGVSTAAFSLHHAELHAHPMHGLALAQIAFTVPMGIVFALLRERSGSLWPAVLLHVATNVPAAL